MDNYENAIEIRGLTKRYDGFTLDSVTFDVPRGSIMGFVGQNGAGKTTTIRSILNIIKADEGEIKVFGLDHIKDEMEIKKRIAPVFDELPFHDVFKPGDISHIFAGLYDNWDEQVFKGWLDRLELPLGKKIGDYSKGMKMKLQIACALSHKAELLIMDEPTTGLDPVVRDEVLHIFMEYLQSGEASILMSSHITSDLEKIADSITFIDSGRILISGSKDDILDRHGIVKCGEESLAAIDRSSIVSVRKGSYGCEVMVNDRRRAARNHPDLIIDPADVDDIMLFYVHKGEEQWS